MGILIRHNASNRIIYYLKGADTVMVSKVNPYYKSFVSDDCDNLAREGLRTLVIAQKYISEEFYVEWAKRY
jgi:phospholipid-translocating ATPase